MLWHCQLSDRKVSILYKVQQGSEKPWVFNKAQPTRVLLGFGLYLVFKPPPPVGAGGGYVFGSSVRAAVRASVRLSVRDSRGCFMFPRYLQYLLTDFHQTFVTGASQDRDELIRFWGQKVKVQGHTIAAEAHSTRRYRRVQLFLVWIFLFVQAVGKLVGWCSSSAKVLFRFASILDYLKICKFITYWSLEDANIKKCLIITGLVQVFDGFCDGFYQKKPSGF